MPKKSTVLRELLRQRHWQTYATFCRQYDEAAQAIDPILVGRWPSRGQFARWLSGDIKGLPHPDHCRVLEAMFNGLAVQQLFTVPDRSRPDPAVRGGSTERPELGDIPDHGERNHHSERHHHSELHDLSERHHLAGSARSGAGLDGPDGLDRLDEPDGLGAAIPAARRASEGRSTSLDHPLLDHAIPVPSGSGGPVSPPRASDSPVRRAPTARPDLSPSVHVLPEEMAMSTEESARFVRGSGGGVDHDVLDQLGADVRQLATDYLGRPPLMLFRPLSRLRAEVFDMLDRRQRPGLLPPLYAVAGRLCALLAHASADLGHSYAAETHTRTAWLCADLADDDSLRAYVRWVQSNVAFWDGDYRRAAQIAHSGQRYATKGSNLLRLASQEARAWAACGETAEVERALALAARTRERPVVDDQAGVFRFDPGKAAYYASEVRLALGGPANARLAVQDATEALALFEDAPEAQRSPEFVAAARLDLANAYLALDDLDGAAAQLRLVLRLPVESRTEPIVGRVTAAGQTLRSAGFTHSGLALELRDEIALFRAYPARRDLSEALD